MGVGITLLDVDRAHLRFPAPLAIARAVHAMARDFAFDAAGVEGLGFGDGVHAVQQAQWSKAEDPPRTAAGTLP